MRTNGFFIFLQVSIASLMQLKQAPVEFDQLLEVRNTIQWCNKKEESNKKLYKYSAACLFMKQNNMYVTTSRCDDYPTSMNSQEAIKEVQ